ncbi:hypothetical protein C8T65DRAFT_656230 [Cerioporus squamosus]|nr:hypothetical protein C8T65DRAFT_656230 [Cerioporus squamosus]
MWGGRPRSPRGSTRLTLAPTAAAVTPTATSSVSGFDRRPGRDYGFDYGLGSRSAPVREGSSRTGSFKVLVSLPRRSGLGLGCSRRRARNG